MRNCFRTFAFNFNLRRYIGGQKGILSAGGAASERDVDGGEEGEAGEGCEAGEK